MLTNPDTKDSSGTIDRRACLGALATSFTSLVMPTLTTANDEPFERDPPEPIPLSLMQQLVGSYELRLEWLFEGEVLVENPKPSAAVVPFRPDGEPEWVPHWKAHNVSPLAEVSVKAGRLELHTNFIWKPPGPLFLGPGPMFSARLDGQRETLVEGKGYTKLLRMIERDESNQIFDDAARHVQEWFYRLSPKDPWKALQTRLTTLVVESPSEIKLTLNHVQGEGLHFKQTIGYLKFKRIEPLILPK